MVKRVNVVSFASIEYDRWDCWWDVLFLGSFGCVGFGFFFGQHNDLEDEVGDPFFAESQSFVILPNGDNGFENAGVGEVVLRENVCHGFLGHVVDGFFEERGQAEFEFHEVTHEHHDVLREVLELYEIDLHVLQLMTIAANALVDFFKEAVVGFIQFFEHFAAVCFFAHAQFVVLCGHSEGGFKHAQIGQHGQIGDAELCSQGGLEVDSDEGHIVFHAACFRGGCLSFKYGGEDSHNELMFQKWWIFFCACRNQVGCPDAIFLLQK